MKKLLKAILIATAIYYTYGYIMYEIAYNKYQKCMIANSYMQETEINTCLQLLK